MSIKRLSTKSIVTCISIVVLLITTSVLFLGFVLPKNVTIVDSDSEAKVKTLAKTVEDVLNENKISIHETDKVNPEIKTQIQDNDVITITRSKKVTLYTDNRTYEIRTHSKTVAELLKEVDVTLTENDALSCSLEDEITDDMTISVTRANFVKVTVDGQTHERYTTKGTVKEFLDDVCIYLEQYDEITPYLETKITDGLDIVISRVTVENVTEEEAIDFKVINKKSDKHEKGKTVVETEGATGVAKNTYKVIKRNGELVSKTLVSSETVKKATDKVVLTGTKEPPKPTPAPTPKPTPKPAQKSAQKQTPKAENNTVSSRGDLRYRKVITCTATAYEPGVQSNGQYAGKTATGLTAGPGVVAVDPNVIPLGSRLYIESTDDGKSWTYGYAVAGDTGGAIKGNKIDLCYSTVEECYSFGRRQCKVYILE